MVKGGNCNLALQIPKKVLDSKQYRLSQKSVQMTNKIHIIIAVVAILAILIAGSLIILKSNSRGGEVQKAAISSIATSQSLSSSSAQSSSLG